MSQTDDTPPACPHSPLKGMFAGKSCLRELGHPGGHCYTLETLESTLAHEAKNRPITDAEMADAYSEADIAARAQAIDQTQTLFESARDKAMPKKLCPTCSGNGQVIGGSMGDHCDTCWGKRYIQDDGVPFMFDMPDFAALRDPTVAYGNALSFRAHGVKALLPDKSTVPDMATIEALRTQAMEAHRYLGSGSPTPNLLPAAAAAARSGFEQDGGIDKTASDAELDEIEDAIVVDPPGGEGG